ncbi:MAG: hypothetical protein B7Y02_07340 [Rhodobacterales bacterium 17-64-5]|nr:MAG: hypothetical protein B7Y02_07340 [Rhodobacterales bacterium 17-64-5]
MMWDWDEDKRQANRLKHGIDFAELEGFDWPNAVTREDTRSDYGERRFISTARLNGRLHVCVWTLRGGQPRIIGLRKANPRERERHAGEEKLH